MEISMKYRIENLLGIIFASLLVVTSGVFAQEANKIKVTLAGTGGPEYYPDRLGIATLVEANGQRLLFDVGRVAGQSLYRARVHPKSIDRIFLTHLHNDHYEGLPELWFSPWFLYQRKHGFEIWGPEGTQQMVDGMKMMFAHDLKMRPNDFVKREYLDIEVHAPELGVIYERDGVKVTAFKVEHRDGNPARGYRVDYDGRSVVLSGDTDFDENLVKHAMGADLIVHNVIAFSEALLQKFPGLQSVLDKLTTPEQAAEVFKRTSPKMAVYSHIVTKDIINKNLSNVLLGRTRKGGYDGPLVLGKDGMVIEVGDKITVHQPLPTEGLPILDAPGQKFP
jgi:ribonuclease Z